MARFLLLLAPERRFEQGLSAAELGRRTQHFVAWVDELRRAGALCGGARLDACGGVGSARTGAAASAGHYLLVEARDRDAALALAASCPAAAPGRVDVFAVDATAELG